MDELVTITKADYERLKLDSKKLSALEAGGVDNWEWYSDSLRDAGFFNDEEGEEDD